MRKTETAGIIAGTAAALALAAPAPAADFYAGKTIEFYIGSSVGGGYNNYARTVGRHLVRHIPGKPDVVFKNMPGAGSRKLTSWLYNVAPKQGTVIGAIFPGALMEPVVGDPKKAKYKPMDFEFIGSAASAVYVCLARADAPVQRFADVFEKKIIMGASQAGGSTRDTVLALKRVLGAKIDLVRGYKGSTEIVAALERGEVQGVCGYAYSSLMGSRPDLVRDGKVKIILQYALDGAPALDQQGVPMVWDFVKKDADRQVLELLTTQQVFGRPYVMPPGTPERLVDMVRAAFDATMKDPAFLADAKKAKLTISPASGKRIRALLKKVYSVPDDVLERARAVQKG
jgi:tripartite-type tricarboxylate transporter receptor subunit TctC